jgi:anaerobic magnesium-protoporphyrin IX monomethyl ester cyclase
VKIAVLNPPRYAQRLNDSLTLNLNVSRFSRGVDIVYGVTPPTELAVLAGVIAERHEVDFLDANALALQPRQVYRWLMETKPDFLLLKAGDSTLLDDLAYYYFAEGIGIPTIVQEDILAPVYHRQMVKDFGIKRLLWGESERAVFRFLDDGELGVVGGDQIENLDELPMPLVSALPMKRYVKEGRSNWYMFLIRGCGWGKCRFCLMESRGLRFRMRSIEHIRRELDLMRDAGIETIYFWDPQFNPSRERVFEVTTLLREYPFQWECWMRTDKADKEILRAMRDSGCFRVHYGVESGDQALLDHIDKGTTPTLIEEAFTNARELGIETVAYLCLGTPTEDKQSLAATRKLLKRIRPTTIVPASFRPFPTASLTRELDDAGIHYQDHYRLALEANCFGTASVCDTRRLSATEVEKEVAAIHALSTRVALCSYLKKPATWPRLAKVFALRCARSLAR